MDFYVCVGSSCHLKGSYDVINRFQEIIKKYEVEDSVTLKASFCLGKCADGVCCKLDDKFLSGVNEENVEDVFLKEVYPLIKK